MYEKERERRFQYEIAKAQSDFESIFTVLIGVIAILYGLLVLYKDNPIGSWSTYMGIIAAFLMFLYALRQKEKIFNRIKKKYVDGFWD